MTRPLFCFCAAFALGCIASQYFLVPALWLPAAGIVLVLGALGLLLRGPMRRRVLLCALGMAFAFGWNAAYARFIAAPNEALVGATEDVLPRLVEGGLRPDVIVVDPPRKGCEEAVLRALLAAQPRRVVYVSCGAPTLARDARILCEGGYAPESVQCVDMFCWTGAVETVMCFSREPSA